jgi:hypothetical protein
LKKAAPTLVKQVSPFTNKKEYLPPFMQKFLAQNQSICFESSDSDQDTDLQKLKNMRLKQEQGI